MMTLPYIPDGELEELKKIDTYTYLSQQEPHKLVRIGRETYCTTDHDSLIISNGIWHWKSRGIGGKSAINYLVHVEGYSFLEAAHKVLGSSSAPIRYDVQPTEKKKYSFHLPKPDKSNLNAIAYLESRGIHKKLITDCIKRKLIFQAQIWDSKNKCDVPCVVFVGYDDRNIPSYAYSRGIDRPFYREQPGSNKEYCFKILRSSPQKKVLIYEAAIDLLSGISLELYKHHRLPEGHFLSLGGVHRQSKSREPKKPIALEHFLHSYPIQEINTHFDNDEVGRGAVDIVRYHYEKSHTVSDTPPSCGKDYNDMLQAYLLQGERTFDRKKNTPVLTR